GVGQSAPGVAIVAPSGETTPTPPPTRAKATNPSVSTTSGGLSAIALQFTTPASVTNEGLETESAMRRTSAPDGEYPSTIPEKSVTNQVPSGAVATGPSSEAELAVARVSAVRVRRSKVARRLWSITATRVCPSGAAAPGPGSPPKDPRASTFP